MEVSTIAAFWAISMLFVITPGADWAYAITAGLSNRAATPAVGGLLAGHLVATIAVSAGAGVLINSIPHAMVVLTIIGAAYLLWLGIGMLRHPSVPSTENIQVQTTSASWALKGFGVSGLNPKVFLLFLAVLPQFSQSSAGLSVSVQMAVLGLVHVLNCAIAYTLVAAFANSVLRSRPEAARIVSQLSGAAMVGIAVLLTFEQIH